MPKSHPCHPVPMHSGHVSWMQFSCCPFPLCIHPPQHTASATVRAAAFLPTVPGDSPCCPDTQQLCTGAASPAAFNEELIAEGQGVLSWISTSTWPGWSARGGRVSAAGKCAPRQTAREQGLLHLYSLLTHLKQAPVTKGAGRRIKIPPTCSLGGQGQK